MTIGQRLRALREAKGMSQEEVAKRIGVGRTTYLKYETGENKPTRKLLELSTLFGVSYDYLLGRDINQQPTESTEDYIVRMLTSDDVEPPSPKRLDLIRMIKHIPDDRLDLAINLLSCLMQDSAYIPTGQWEIDKSRVEKESRQSEEGA